MGVKLQMAFSEQIKKWRGGTPQKIACDILGVEIKTLQSWEQGVQVPKEITQEQIILRMEFCTEWKPWGFWKSRYAMVIKQVAAEIQNRK